LETWEFKVHDKTGAADVVGYGIATHSHGRRCCRRHTLVSDTTSISTATATASLHSIDWQANS